MHSQSCLEVAVYEVTTEDFDETHVKTHQHLTDQPGFQASIALRGHRAPTLRADLVLWSSPAEAHAASEAMKSDPRFAGFMQTIAKITVFGHYHGLDRTAFDALKASPLLEVVAYPLDDEETALHRRQLHDVLTQHPPVCANIAADVHGPATATAPAAVDLIGWTDEAAHKGGPQAVIHARPELAPLFSDRGPPPVILALFSVLPPLASR